MEQYQSMAKSIEGIKRPLIIIAVVSMLTHLLILGVGILTNKDNKMQKFTTMEACFYGMKSLFENNPSEEMFHKDVLKGSNGKKFEIEDITLIKVLDGHNCDVIAKDAQGFLSYRVGLEKNTSFAHFYRIFDVKGQPIVSPYQWKASL